MVRLPRGLRWHLAAARFLTAEHVDVYLSPSSYIVPTLVGYNVSCVPVVHDLIAFLNEPHDRKATRIERFLLRRVVRTAAHILCVSESTATALHTRFPSLPSQKLSVCYAGPTGSRAALNEADGRTILGIGTLCPRKNQKRLIEAYAALPGELRTQYRLILAGPRGWDDDEIVTAARSTSGVEWRGYVSNDELHELLRACTVFAYPSLQEGFGLPLLNALQRGIPTLTSSGSSLAEVAGDAALLVHPEDTAALTQGLFRLLTDEPLRTRLRAAGPKQAARFSWEITAQIVADTLEQAARTA